MSADMGNGHLAAALGYEPRPISTTDVSLPPELLELCEMLAANAHDVWARERLRRGWQYGTARDDLRKAHPRLVPYGCLSEEEKDLDRAMTREVLKVLLKLGFRIERVPHREDPERANPR